MTPWKNVDHFKAARMHPGMNLPDPLVSLNDSLDTPVFSSFNRCSVLPEECLFSLTLSPISSSSHKCFRCHLRSQSDLRSALKISRLRVFSPSSLCSSSLSHMDVGSEEPLTLPVIVNDSLPASLLISGASSQFIDIDYASRMKLEMTLKPKSQDLILADGKPSLIGKITYTCTLKLTIDQHEENLTFQVTKLASWDLTIRKPWLRRHNPLIDWSKNTCIFHSRYCQSHCLPIRPKPNPPPPDPKLGRIALISRVALRIVIARPGAECFVIAIIAPEDDPSRTAPNCRPGRESGLTELSAQLVLPEYYDYL